MANGNGSHRPSLELLGAPKWYIEGERRHSESHQRHEDRISALEQAIVKGAGKQGRKWGATAGAFVGAAIAVAAELLKN